MQRVVRELDAKEESAGAMSPERALAAIRKRLKLVVALPALTACLAAAVVALIPDRFEASAIVQIDPRQKLSTEIEGAAPDLKGDRASEDEIEIIRSRPVVLHVIDKLGLSHDPEFSRQTLLTKILRWPGASSTTPAAADIDKIVRTFSKRMRVSRIRNTLLIGIRFSASDAAKAARIANTIAEVYTHNQQKAGAEGLQLPDARIIEQADAPQRRASPKRRQLVLMAAIGGLVVALALAVLIELRVPVRRERDGSERDGSERVFDADHVSSVPSPNASGTLMPPMKTARLVVAEPQSVYAQAIHNARRELDIRRRTPAPRLILVTSSVAGEGAELIASNLAYSYAATGARTLLIDADFRAHHLTRLLATACQTGFYDQLSPGGEVDAAILRDTLTGLHFLPATGGACREHTVAGTLASQAMANALAKLKSTFDTIVMSAPPLMPVMDGRTLASYADQIVLVVAWQNTSKDFAKAAAKTLGVHEQKLAGVVLSEFAPGAGKSVAVGDGRGQYAA